MPKRNRGINDDDIKLLEWELAQNEEVSVNTHNETMKQLDLELAKEDLSSCQATVRYAEWVKQATIDHEQQWQARLHTLQSDQSDNTQEANSFHVMPNLYLRVVVL